jgi:methanogenic corrinoid protein MtbC1
MIRWCSYCQKFLGESPPWDDLRITHGVCPSCAKDLSSPDRAAHEDKAIILSGLFSRMRAVALSGNPGSAQELIQEARKSGIRPLDLALGMVQPVLNELGSLWSRDAATVATEHSYSAFADELIALVFAQCPETAKYRGSSEPLVLLSNVEGNYHTLGLRFLELGLSESCVPNRVILPGLPARQLVAEAIRLGPRILGISASLPDQLGSVREIARLVKAMPADRKPRVVLGGHLAREGLEFRNEFDIETAPDLASFLDSIVRA